MDLEGSEEAGSVGAGYISTDGGVCVLRITTSSLQLVFLLLWVIKKCVCVAGWAGGSSYILALNLALFTLQNVVGVSSLCPQI